MPQYGSTQNLISQNLSQTVDNQGNPIISSDTGFGASPLGYAARVQALFGLPNATFELTPPDTTAIISAANQLPYWDIQDYSSAVMSGSAVYDSTTNAWGVNLNPGTAASGDYLTMTTRSYLVNDSNLSLRQQALSVVSKVGTYAGTTQWNMQLTATYYDQTDTLLHSGTVATIYDNTTWTSMAGTTTTGGTAISAAAHYVDLTYKLTATAAVTSSTSVTIKSCLLQTSTGAAGSQSFLVREAFTGSGTWTRPTGVEYIVAVVGVGAGGSGGRGSGRVVNPAGRLGIGTASGGGGGSRWGILRELYVGDVATVSVGIGAGGVGAAGSSTTRSPGTSLANVSFDHVDGSAGGATTFGTYLSIPGGAGGVGGGAAAGTTITSPMYGLEQLTAGQGGQVGSGVAQDRSGGTPQMVTGGYTILPYWVMPTTSGGTGGSSFTSVSAGSQFFSTGIGTAASVPAGISGGGGAPAFGSATSSNNTTNFGGGAGVASSGGGGAGVGVFIMSGTATITATSGSGGNAAPNSGAGGGGSGGAIITANNTTAGTAGWQASTSTVTVGKAGDGADGAIYVFYVA